MFLYVTVITSDVDLQKELVNNEIILSIFSKNYYHDSIYEILRKLEGKRTCYITLNKTAGNLERALKLQHLSTNNIFFIDAVSRGIGNTEAKENTFLVSSPQALTELSIAVTESLKSGKFEVLLFDSLSTLNIYKLKGKAAERFTTQIIDAIKAKQSRCIFTCLEEDTDSDLIKNSFRHMDKVLHPNLFKSKNRKNWAAVFSATAMLLALITVFSSGGKFKQKLTGYLVVENIPADPNFLLLLSGAFSFALILFVGAVLYKKYSLKLISDEELEQMPVAQGSVAALKKNIRNKIFGWLSKVE